MENKPIVLPLKTVRNPRDLGGYVGFAGRRIKKGRLIRSGKITSLSQHDQQFLQNYGLRKVIDLRSPLEAAKSPDPVLPGVTHLNLSLSEEDNTEGGSADLAQMWAAYQRDQYAGFAMMCRRYRQQVAKPHAQQTLRQILRVLAATPHGAVLYHCSEGKDRTGIVTLIILYVLGVDLETIRQDYLASNYLLNDYRALRDRKLKAQGANLNLRANMRILGSVANAFLDTALITIQKNFWGLDQYLKDELDVTPALQTKLRALYLEKE